VSKELTPTQGMIYEYIFEHAMREGFQPSMRELQAHFGFNSPSATICHMKALQKKGYIMLGGGQSRANRFLLCPDGSKFCGFICKEGQDGE
jgi:repressor LexA